MLCLGKKCYLKIQGNSERYYKGEPIEKKIRECEIVKIGRKYFTVLTKTGQSIQFEIDTLDEKTQTLSDWKFYFEKQDILDEEEYKNLEISIRMYFSNCIFSKSKLSLEKLRKISAIIEEQENINK